MEEKQLSLSEEFEKETLSVPVQERTLRIYKPFIRCATCARNINTEKMQHGFYEKTYCNFYKQERQDQYKADYDIIKDRRIAQHCQYYLPEIGTLADLSYIKPYDIINDYIDLPKDHAENLNNMFAYKGE